MILGIIIGLILFPIFAFLIGNISSMTTIMSGKIVTSVETPQGKLVSEGQRWNLKNKISEDLPPGIYLIKTCMSDSVFMPREDEVRYLPQGAAAIYPTNILDDDSFELLDWTSK
jgi:hypothetical protein